MKNVFFIVPFLFTFSSFASELTAYRCEYTAELSGKKPFRMTGNLIASDVEAGEAATYLTLQPPGVTGIKLDARILVTNTGYNPVTLHARGQTSTLVASTELKDDGAEITHRESDGSSYKLKCSRR
jgi:hypothetical protein